MPADSRAVFLSYASEDRDAAARIADALKAAGIEVWFDRSALRGGDVWDAQIRQQIKACALFVPLLSRQAHAREEGYFRLEWKLAVDRSYHMTEDRSFLVPIVIDDTPDDEPRVPDRFRAVQWTRLAAGPTPEFVARIAALLAREPGQDPVAARAREAATVPPVRVWRRRGVIAVLAAAVILAVAGAAWFVRAPPRVAATASRTGPVAGADAERTVAVLPFENMSSDREQDYFSAGLAEELIDTLTKVPGLRVPARTSSFAFKGRAVTVGDIGRALGVAHVLEGSVRKSGAKLRVTAQLVRSDDGFHVWSQTYDRDDSDAFEVQDDIARSVARQLQLTLIDDARPAAEQGVTAEAHSLYLQGRSHLALETDADLATAIDRFERAIGIAPRYAAAWGWLAYGETRRVANGDTTSSTYERARDASRKAREFDPNLAIGYVAGAIVALQYSLDWKSTGQLLDEALARDPNNALALQLRAHLTQAVGSLAQAEQYARRSVDMDPLNPLHGRYLARIVLNAGRAAESESILRPLIAANPRFPALHYELARALYVQGRFAEAASAYEAEPAVEWRRLGTPIAAFVTHRTAEARAALAAMVADPRGGEFQVAETYAVFGDVERALQWLELARTHHDAGLMYVRHNPFMANVYADPRYAAFERRAGLLD
ncbi:MAG: TIR domain-containing protein [Proteobacteria bacterium]|nr:TIR domain-containing protein [Pseudomonadota bacterium]